MLFFKKQIINIFLDIKNIFNNIMNENNWLYFNKKKYYFNFLTEIFEVLSNTLSKIETIYYKYFLFPKLEQIYKVGSNN